MKHLSIKSIIMAFTLAAVILPTNMPLNFAYNFTNKNEIQAAKTDTLYIKATEIIQGGNKKKKKTDTFESTSNLSYNIVYYWVSKVVQLITITRSR